MPPAIPYKPVICLAIRVAGSSETVLILLPAFLANHAFNSPTSGVYSNTIFKWLPIYLGNGTPIAVETKKGIFLLIFTRPLVPEAKRELSPLKSPCMVSLLASSTDLVIDIPSGTSSNFLFNRSHSPKFSPASLNCLSREP